MNLFKPKLKIHVKDASHFLRWEIPYFKKYFQIVDRPDPETVLFVFGPDVLREAADLPAKLRISMLFPGFGKDPYHNLEHRQEFLKVIDDHYDLAFMNPGPLERAYSQSSKISSVPFTIDSTIIQCRAYRKKINSLLHVSYPWPQKDWERSEKIMQMTRLKYEVFPARNSSGTVKHDCKTRLKLKWNTIMRRCRVPYRLPISSAEMCGYTSHARTIKKYQDYDAFVHVAAPVPNCSNLDGKYTACLFEAALTGSIIFWHDTFSLGNNFETFFNLPKDEKKAAEAILAIRNSINVERHSKLTREEVMDKCNVEKSVSLRCQKILELLDTRSTAIER